MKLSEAISEAIDKVEQEREGKRKKRLVDLMNYLSREAANARCDVSAIGEGHHLVFKDGHKQARHAITERILEVMNMFIDTDGGLPNDIP